MTEGFPCASRFAPDHACRAFLLERFAFGSRPPYVSIGRSCVRSRLSLFLCQEKRDGLRDVAFLSRRVGIALVRSHDFVRLSDLFGSLWACAFFYGDPDGERGQQRGVSMFLRNHISPAMLSAGNTLGLKCGSRTAAAPDCAKEPLALWTLFI